MSRSRILIAVYLLYKLHWLPMSSFGWYINNMWRTFNCYLAHSYPVPVFLIFFVINNLATFPTNLHRLSFLIATTHTSSNISLYWVARGPCIGRTLLKKKILEYFFNFLIYMWKSWKCFKSFFSEIFQRCKFSYEILKKPLSFINSITKSNIIWSNNIHIKRSMTYYCT